MKDSIILVDADGVLLNWEYAFAIWMEQHGFTKVPGSEFEYDIGRRYGIDKEQGRKLIKMFNESAAIGFLPPLRDARHPARPAARQRGRLQRVPQLCGASPGRLGPPLPGPAAAAGPLPPPRRQPLGLHRAGQRRQGQHPPGAMDT